MSMAEREDLLEVEVVEVVVGLGWEMGIVGWVVIAFGWFEVKGCFSTGVGAVEVLGRVFEAALEGSDGVEVERGTKFEFSGMEE